jgi:hypothetical protein
MTAPATASDGVPARSARSIAELSTGIGWEELPDRDLDRHELLELAASIAEQPQLWRKDVAFGEGSKRHYANLHRDAHVDVWLLCWTPQGDTGWHDHDASSGAVAVAQGKLVEHNLSFGTPTPDGIETEIAAGSGYAFGPDHIHRLTGRDPYSVSVHAYSPPLWRMGQYAVSEVGVLRRSSVSYADELRPLDG